MIAEESLRIPRPQITYEISLQLKSHVLQPRSQKKGCEIWLSSPYSRVETQITIKFPSQNAINHLKVAEQSYKTQFYASAAFHGPRHWSLCVLTGQRQQNNYELKISDIFLITSRITCTTHRCLLLWCFLIYFLPSIFPFKHI